MQRGKGMARHAVEIIGDGNIEWRGTEHRAMLAQARLGDESPLINLHKLLVAAAPTAKRIRRDGAAFVYVISDIEGEYSKIGYAVSAPKRLASLQTGNPKKLYIHRSFIITKLSVAKRVEFWAHTIASEKHKRLEGEWFHCSPSQAHTAIEEARKEVGCSCAVATPTFVTETSFIKDRAA